MNFRLFNFFACTLSVDIRVVVVKFRYILWWIFWEGFVKGLKMKFEFTRFIRRTIVILYFNWDGLLGLILRLCRMFFLYTIYMLKKLLNFFHHQIHSNPSKITSIFQFFPDLSSTKISRISSLMTETQSPICCTFFNLKLFPQQGKKSLAIIFIDEIKKIISCFRNLKLFALKKIFIT